MAAYDFDKIEGIRKVVYGDKLEDLVPEENSVAKDVKFVSSELKLGKEFHQPVRVTRSHGWTVAEAGTAYALNDAEPCITQNAVITGISFTIRESIPYDTLAACLSGSSEKKKRAFVSATAHVYDSMGEAGMFVREIAMLWGSQPLGIIDAETDDSGTTQTHSLTTATYIPALWGGYEGGYIDIWDPTGATQRNAANTIKVTATSIADRTLTMLGNETELDTVASGDYVYLRGFKGLGLKGLWDIFTNTGTLFTIVGTTYGLFLGNTKALADGQLVFENILQSLNLPANRGMKGNLCGYVSSSSWTDAMNNLAALRRYAEKKGGSLTQGAEGLLFETHAGSLTLKHHLFMQPSKALFFPPSKCKRIGSSDLTFKLPGSENYFPSQLSDNAGVQVRGYWNQAPYSAFPCHGIGVTGIKNSDQ